MTEGYSVLEHSHGYTSKIYCLPGDPPRVCKAFNHDCIETHFPVEREAYERFSNASQKRPSGIIDYFGVHDSIPAGLVLGLAQNGNTWEFLWQRKPRGRFSKSESLRPEVLLKWAAQAAEALAFAHGLGVLNSDIHPINFFLDSELDLKVGDWAGASIDGGNSYSSYRLKYRLFDREGTDVARRDGISVKTEVFALGSAFYFLVTGDELWPELDEPSDKEEIKRRLAGQEWPDVRGLSVLGDVILNCWNLDYANVMEVGRAISIDRELSSKRN